MSEFNMPPGVSTSDIPGNKVTPPGIPPVFVEAAKEVGWEYNKWEGHLHRVAGDADVYLLSNGVIMIDPLDEKTGGMHPAWPTDSLTRANRLVKALEDKPEEITDQDIEAITPRIRPDGIQYVGVLWMADGDPGGYMATPNGDGTFRFSAARDSSRSTISAQSLKALLGLATSIQWPPGHRLAAPPALTGETEGENTND